MTQQQTEQQTEQQAQQSGWTTQAEGAGAYASLAPRVEDWPRLVGKIGASMADDFDFSEQVRGLRVPTLFVAADADMFPPRHAVEVFELLGGGQRDGGWDGSGHPIHQLAIIPGETHYSMGSSPKFAAAVISFLDEAQA